MRVSIDGSGHITGYDDTRHAGDVEVDFDGNPAMYPNFPTGYTVTGTAPNRKLIQPAFGNNTSQVVAVELSILQMPDLANQAELDAAAAGDVASLAAEAAARVAHATAATAVHGVGGSTVLSQAAADSRYAPDALVPLDARDYITTGSTFDLAAALTDAASEKRAVKIVGSLTPSSFNIPLDAADNNLTYKIVGDGKGSILNLPAGMVDGDYVLLPNSAHNATLYAHPDVVVEDLLMSGTASVNAGFLYTYGRSIHARRVRFYNLKWGFVVDGYADMNRLEGIYADTMTSGGWVFKQLGDGGDGLTVDGFMAYASAGISLTRCKGARISGLISGWHEFIDSDVELAEPHNEGDGTTNANPLISVKGSRVHIPSGRLYCTKYRPAITVDDSAASTRKSRLHLGRSLVFAQRLDGPASTLGALQGTAVSLVGFNNASELILDGPKCEIFGQTAGASRAGVVEQILPKITSDDTDIQTALDARKVVQGGRVELRKRNSTWEIVAPDPLDVVRTTRRVTGAPFLQTTAVSGAGYVTTLVSGTTYYYKIWTRDSEGRDVPASSEASATPSGGQPNIQLDVNLYHAPCTLRIVRGTAAGVYDKWAEVVVLRETPSLFDQGDAIAGQAWQITPPAVPTDNTTQDGLVVRGTQGRAVIWQSAAPTVGGWAVGDLVVNNGATGPLGWRCTVAGTPGTWEPIGTTNVLVDAKGDLLAGTAADTLGRLAVGTDDFSLVADSTQTTGLNWKARSRIAAEAHVDAGSASSTAEQTLADLTIPSTVAAGDLIRLIVFGDLLNNTGSSVNYTWKFYVGATTVLASAARSVATGTTRRKWRFEASILVVTAASAQRVSGHIVVSNTTADTLTMSPTSTEAGVGYGTAAEDLTANKNAKFTATLGTSDALADVIQHFAVLEVVKK